MRRLVVPFVTAVLLGVGASPALASSPRYVSPTGLSTNDCSTPATACDIVTAIDSTSANPPVDGQEIIVEPGTYTLSATLTPNVDHLDVHGVAGEPRPVIQGTGFQLLEPTAYHETFSHLEFDSSGTLGGNDEIDMLGGVLDGLLIKGEPDGNLCQCYDGILRNSVLVTSSPIGSGAWGLNSNGGSATETLRNDTLIATTPTAYAIAMAQSGSPVSPTTIDVKNVIAINTAGGNDVFSYGPMATVHIADSDFSSPHTGNGGVIADDGGNISAAPQFLNLAAGDYRELPGSPTIDAGTDDAANDGTLDFGGGPRLAGAHTDIGAFEYQPPATLMSTGGQGQSATVGQPFAQPLAVEVLDAQGNPVPDAAVTFTAPASGASAGFAGSASAQVVAASDGIASVPAPTANSIAGAYTVHVTVSGVTTPASFALHNTPGPVASLKLTPQSATAAAGTATAYVVEGFDGYGNDAGPAGAGLALSISPDGSCSGLSCSALAPGPHTITATLGSVSATAALQVTPLAPTLSVPHRGVRITRHTRRGQLPIGCTAPAGEVCTVTARITGRRHGHLVLYGTIGGTVPAGASGSLTVKVTPAGIAWLRHHMRHVPVKLAAADTSGTSSASVALALSLSPR